MRAGIIGFVLGVILVFLALIVGQHLVIKVSADDLIYRFRKCVFSESTFPWGYLDQGRVITRCLFPVKITTTFYDAQYHEVTQADKPGRYGAVVRIGFLDGTVVHRFITLYRTPAKVYWSDGPMIVSAQLPPGTGIDPSILQTQEQEIGRAVKQGYCGLHDESPTLAVLLAGLSETPPADPPAVNRTNADARDADWWFGLRQRLGLPKKYPFLVDLPHGYDADSGKRWPLILYLHGGAQRGKDLQPVRGSGLPGLIADGKQLPAIVVAPQIGWTGDWNTPVLFQLLDEVSAKYRVDPDRVYLIGISVGGDGAWDLALAHPERFAAVVPIAGESDPADAARIKDIPTWAFVGLKDEVVEPRETMEMVDAVRKAGGHSHLTVFPQAGHDSWDQAFATDALYTWLLAQKRGQPEVITPGVPTP